MSTNVGVDTATAAARRRQRRLRSWLRHERMTVAMTLAEMTHHTAPRGPKMARVGEEVVHDAHEALWGQKTPPPGTQPAALREPGLQLVSEHAGCPCSCLPSLATPSLADTTADVVDSSSVRFLAASALKARREEEKKEEKEKQKADLEKSLDVHAEASAALERAHLWSELASKRRKRKKRRKRRTPRTSSRPSHRRPRRWHAPGWFSSVFLLALCSSLSLAGPRCSASRLFGTRRTVTRFFLTVACATLVLLVLYTSRCVFSLVCRPMMLGIMAGVDQTDILALVDTGSCMVKAGFTTGYDTPHACSLWAVGRSVMFGIMAGMDQKNTFRRICHRCSSWTRLSCPLCETTYALVQLLTVEVPQVQLIIKVIYIPVGTQSLIPMALTVEQIIEISQLQFLDKELTCPLLGHTGASWCSTSAALGQGCRARCVHDKCPDPDRRAVQKTVEIPQLQFFFKVVIIPVGAPRQVPMVSLFSRPRRFSCCSTLTRCSTIWLCSPAGSSGCSRGENGLDPTVAHCSRVQTWRKRSRSHSCNVDAGHCCSHACRFATTGVGDVRDSAVFCGGSAVGAHRPAWFF